MMININGSNPTTYLESIVQIIPESGALYFIEIDETFTAEAVETIRRAFESAHAYCVIRKV